MTDSLFERYKDALKRGHMAVMRGRPKDALTSYAEAASLVPHRSLPHTSMGSVLLKMGRRADALAAYERACELAPGDPVAHAGRAAALTDLKRLADAAGASAEAARLRAADHERRMAEESDARAAVSGRGPELLVADAGDLLEAGHEEAAVARLVAAADGFTAAGQPDAALDACAQGLAIAPGSPAVHLVMIRAYLARGWNDMAVERLVLLDRLLTLDPDPVWREAHVRACRDNSALDARLAAFATAHGAAVHGAGSTA